MDVIKLKNKKHEHDEIYKNKQKRLVNTVMLVRKHNYTMREKEKEREREREREREVWL